MKKILPLFFMLLATAAVAQNRDYIISTDGIGALKLGMTQTELEKVLKTKITLKVIGVDSVMLGETIQVKYKGINVTLGLAKRQGYPDADYVAVDGISSSSPLCKTKSGIGVGSNKLQILAAYEGYFIDISPVYEGDDNPIKSKTRRSITIKEDREGYAIIFNLNNNKVVSFDIIPIYDDEE